LARLNAKQRAAVTRTEGPLLVLAGAGSGKTTVLTERIAQIIRNGTPPWAVIAITFTNKAAGELKERLERLLGPQSRDIWASTFHSACVRILRREIECLGFTRSFTIYDADDATRVVKLILGELFLSDSRLTPKAVLGAISRAKNEMLTPSAYEARVTGDFRGGQIAQVYRTYQQRLRAANALDFDDLIWHAVVLLRDFEEVRARYQRQFQYVLVDEYQDTNRLQYLLTSMLAGGTRNLCVVGDDDQSIYRFRGATIENILQFEAQYPDAAVIRLEQNYRSTGAILAAANHLIAHNRGRKGKTLWTDNPPGKPVTVHSAYSDGDEASYVAGRVLDGVRQGRPFKDFCVLYRINALSNRMEDAFKRNGVPYRIIGGVRFFDRAEVKDMLAYLCVIHNRDDEVRLGRILNTPARGIGGKTVEMADYLARRDSRPLFSVLREAADYPELSRAARAIGGFTALIDALTEELPTLTLADFYKRVVERVGYAAQLAERADRGDIEAAGRLENVWELQSSVAQYEENAEAPTLGGFLDEVALFTDIERYDADADAVVMMTMHAAKGLEFPVVFVTGAEEGLFPGRQSQEDEESIEEERRLCYVAMTRAQEELYITCAYERMLFGQTAHNPVSRFVRELPAHADSDGGGGDGAAAVSSARPAGGAGLRGRPSKSAAPSRFRPPAAAAPPPPPLQVGQTVVHKVFGRGMVLTVQPMGGDALLEIAFDSKGTKRIMHKSAGPYLTVE
jgi:DNA helicase-2/ATP-dependent DNA helicase PcrA